MAKTRLCFCRFTVSVEHRCGHGLYRQSLAAPPREAAVSEIPCCLLTLQVRQTDTVPCSSMPGAEKSCLDFSDKQISAELGLRCTSADNPGTRVCGGVAVEPAMMSRRFARRKAQPKNHIRLVRVCCQCFNGKSLGDSCSCAIALARLRTQGPKHRGAGGHHGSSLKKATKSDENIPDCVCDPGRRYMRNTWGRVVAEAQRRREHDDDPHDATPKQP